MVVLANEDIVNGRTRNIAEEALAHLLEAKFGTKSPPGEKFSAPSNLSELAGDYESQSFWARLELCDGTLTGEISGQRAVFTPAGRLNSHMPDSDGWKRPRRRRFNQWTNSRWVCRNSKGLPKNVRRCHPNGGDFAAVTGRISSRSLSVNDTAIFTR